MLNGKATAALLPANDILMVGEQVAKEGATTFPSSGWSTILQTSDLITPPFSGKEGNLSSKNATKRAISIASQSVLLNSALKPFIQGCSNAKQTFLNGIDGKRI